MPASYTQDTRIARLNTPFGKDKLLLSRFDATEGVSEPFEIRIEALSTDPNLDFNGGIGRNCTVDFNVIGQGKRYFDGILAEAQWLGQRHDLYVYRIVLRPWLWLMSFTRDCFIFHEKTAPDIIKEVFGRHGFAKFTDNLKKSYPTIEYCVQYRESDMAFVCRLMEQHGIAYYFQHQDGEHKLILCDEASSYEAIAKGSREFIPLSRQHRRGQEHFHNWAPERRFTSGKVMINDYQFKQPTLNLKVEQSASPGFENGDLEVYDYPGKFYERGDGEKYAQARIDMERAPDGHFLASGDCVSCFPGSLVTLKGHPDGSQNTEYLALRCSHSFLAEDYRSGAGGGSGEDTYQGSYEFIRSDRPYAPPMVTEKPTILGPQTAVVVGDGEIDVDEHGRIEVRFHWDRKNDKSCRVRIGNGWSGKQWGDIRIPRVGMEVICIFLEGDPDQPLVIGTVYNGDNKPPYPLPDKKNLSGSKSNSTTGGGGYNEITMDDSKGNELLRVHGQYDLESLVENDERWHIKRDRKTNIDNNEKFEVKINRDLKIGVNNSMDVGAINKLEAGAKIEFICGMSKITMTPVSIKMESLMIEVSAVAQFKTTALISQHGAAAMMDIKGTIVKINS
jgi:type VI secretion system secreted protein VgrG